jgi:hypothetical protein
MTRQDIVCSCEVKIMYLLLPNLLQY